MTMPFALFQQFGLQEMLILGGLALLLFGGRRLPELGRSLGKGIVEFKKGLKGLEDDVEGGDNPKREPAGELPRPPQRITPPAPRFEDAKVDSRTPPS